MKQQKMVRHFIVYKLLMKLCILIVSIAWKKFLTKDMCTTLLQKTTILPLESET